MQRKRLDKKQFRKTLLYTVIFLLSICAVLGLFALKAYAACAHQFYNSVCVHCGYECQSCSTGQGQEYRYEYAELIRNKHTVYRLCTDCRVEYNEGLEDCTFNLENICTKCGGTYIDTSGECTFHNYVYGTCSVCGYECLHLTFENSVCTTCGITCAHSNIDMRYTPSTTSAGSHILKPWCADCDIGVLIDHPDIGKLEACTWSSSGNGKCTKCQRSHTHTEWKDGKCVTCSYGCGHSKGSTYTYEPVTSSTSYHVVRAWCVTCGARNTGDPLNGAHVKCTFSGVSCTNCKRTCSHSYITTYNQRENDYEEHTAVKTCQICKYVTTVAEKHSYDIQNECEACGIRCVHKFSNSKCVYCSYQCTHPTYKDEKCTLCAMPCPHNSFSYKRTPVADRDDVHQLEATCNHCGKKTVSTEAHSYSQSECEQCSYRCSHKFWDNGFCKYCNIQCVHPSYIDEKCTLCTMPCPHNSFSYKRTPVADRDDVHQLEATCNHCGKKTVSTETHSYNEKSECEYCSYRCNHIHWRNGFCIYCDYECLHLNCKNDKCAECGVYCPFDYTQFFDNVPSSCTGNANTSIFSEPSELGGVDRYYERYTIKEFVEKYDYKCSAHIIGGSSIRDSFAFDSSIIASRYLLLRVRLSGIKHFEVYAYGGNIEQHYQDVVNECSSINFFDVEDLPENEWFDLVVDMSLFDELYGSTYSVGDTISHAFISLCFAYESVDSYVDLEYFALCDDTRNVDIVNNYSGYNPVSHYYYLADGEYSLNPVISHSFGSNVICQNCGYECEHVDTYSVDISTNTDCGSETRCILCEALLRSTVRSHFFNTDNSDTCSNCSFVCTHRYSGGVCMYCEWECIHNHSDGSIRCSNCGYYLDYEGYNDPAGFQALFTAIYDAQANTFFKMLGYEILGVNVAGLIVSVIALAIVIWLLKKVL